MGHDDVRVYAIWMSRKEEVVYWCCVVSEETTGWTKIFRLAVLSLDFAKKTKILLLFFEGINVNKFWIKRANKTEKMMEE